MPASNFLKLNNGVITEEAPATAGGGGNENKIPALDGSGRLPTTMMPTGIGADTQNVTASENLSAGDLVNVYDDTGTAKVRKADASTSGKEAHGFVLAAVTSGNPASVYFEGTNDQLSTLTAGRLFLSATTPGAVTSTPPSSSGQVVQMVGLAVSATTMNFEAGSAIVLA